MMATDDSADRHPSAEVCSILTPDTILRWYRQLIARKYDGSYRRRPDRPKIRDRFRSLIVRKAGENGRLAVGIQDHALMLKVITHITLIIYYDKRSFRQSSFEYY